MNNTRRKDLETVIKALEVANGPLSDALNDLEAIKDEEQEAQENTEESFPGSERAEAMAEAVDALTEALAKVQEMADLYDDALEAIRTAQQ